MSLEHIAQAAHEAARKWFDESVPVCWQHSWEELDDKEKKFLLSLAEDIISHPDMMPVSDVCKSARQVFLEGIFWGSVRTLYVQARP